MSTSLEKVEAALHADVVVAAQQKIGTLETYDAEAMEDSDEASLVDVGTMIAVAIRKLEDDQRETLAPFNDGIAKIRTRFAAVLNPLKAAKVRIGGPGGILNQFREVKRSRAERVRLEQEASARAAAAAVEQESEGLMVPAAETVVPEVRNTVTGGIGKASGRRMPHAKAVDLIKIARYVPGLLELNGVRALAEYRAALARHRGDEAAAIAWMAERGVEVYYVETTSFGAR